MTGLGYCGAPIYYDLLTGIVEVEEEAGAHLNDFADMRTYCARAIIFPFGTNF